MTRRDTVERHLQDLEDMLAELEVLRGRSVDELRADRTSLLALEHALQRAIQNVLDIAAHILSDMAVNQWEDYREAATKLGEQGVVTSELAERLASMAGLRNILVHGYIDLDVARLASLVDSQLDDFRTFARAILEYLDRSG